METLEERKKNLFTKTDNTNSDLLKKHLDEEREEKKSKKG